MELIRNIKRQIIYLENDIFKFCPKKITKVKYNGTTRPEARTGHRIVANNTNVYCYGGYNADIVNDNDDYEDGLFKELWKYNISSKIWLKLNTEGGKPQHATSHSAILLQDYLLVFGGTSVPFGLKNSNTLTSYDTQFNYWRIIPTTGSHPPKLYGQALAVQDDYLYSVGGASETEYFLDVHALNLKTKQWEYLFTKEHPLERFCHEIAIYKNKIYLFGGGTSSDTFELKDIPVFDLSNRKWEIITTTDDRVTSNDLPGKRKCHGCVQFDKDVYIFGGFNGRIILSDIWKVDLEVMQWTKYQYNLPQAVYFHSVAANPNGQIFIFGGITMSISCKIRTNEMYSLWLDIPPLKEICWLAILHYVPHLSKVPVDILFSIGIPNKFINRLYM